MDFLTKFTKQSIAIIILVLFVTISASAIIPLWGDFITSIGGTLKNAGMAVAIMNILTAIFTAISAIFETKYAKYLSFFTIAGFLILSISYFYYIFIHSVLSLYVTLIFISLGSGMIWPAFDTIYQTTFNKKDGAIFWAIFNLSFDFGTGLGAFIGAHTVSNFGFSILFLTISALCMIGFIFSLFFLPKEINID